MSKTTRARRRAEGAVGRIERLLPRPARDFLRRARTNDVFLFSAALAFYAIISVVPLTVLIVWIVSAVMGDHGVQQLTAEIGRIAPKSLGADRLVQRVAQQGTRLGVVAAITGLWPATAYGSGLERAFDGLGPKREQKLEGLRGRGLFFLILLPVFVGGSLLGSFVGSKAVGSSGIPRIVGYVLALGTGFVATSIALILIYRIFPPTRLSWRDIFRATLIAAAGISILSFLFLLFVSLGTNFEKHYATSGLASLVLMGVWLFLANVLLLEGYRVALER
jgi:membrane protein